MVVTAKRPGTVAADTGGMGERDRRWQVAEVILLDEQRRRRAMLDEVRRDELQRLDDLVEQTTGQLSLLDLNNPSP